MTVRKDQEALSVSLTKVDLSSFLAPTAKIDRIDLGFREHELPRGFVAQHQSHLEGRLIRPRSARGREVRGYGLAMHDPTTSDLQYLSEHFYDTQVFSIEIAVDIRSSNGSNDLAPLEVLKAQLRHCLFPQQHPWLETANRKVYDTASRRFRKDGLGLTMHNQMGEVIWEKLGAQDKLAMYIKTQDQGQPVAQPCVRMEARLYGLGCKQIGLSHVGKLARFASDIRTQVGDMFFVGDGFKNESVVAVGHGVPKNPWERWGAQWRGKATTPVLRANSAVNAKLGQALNDLRTKLKRLKPPQAIADRYDQWLDEKTY